MLLPLTGRWFLLKCGNEKALDAEPQKGPGSQPAGKQTEMHKIIVTEQNLPLHICMIIFISVTGIREFHA
jgi:hypothetical protein